MEFDILPLSLERHVTLCGTNVCPTPAVHDDRVMEEHNLLYVLEGEWEIGQDGKAYKLKSGDKVLISEGCTHHRQCGDIGTVKLPKLIAKYTGLSDLQYEWTSGTGFADKLTEYKMVIHCGGCMLSEREMQYRLKFAQDEGVSITNYGTAIAYMNGILKRSLDIFPDIADLLR